MMTPILYAATSRRMAERNVPRELLSRGVELSCSACNVAVVVMNEDFAATLLFAQKSGRPVVVLCETCIEDAKANLDELVTLHFDDPEVQSLLDRYQAEKN